MDDDLRVGTDIQEIFREDGHDADYVAEARAALRQLQQASYDIILIDASVDVIVRRRSTLTDILLEDYPSIRRVAFTGQFESCMDHLTREKYHAIVSKPARRERVYEAMNIPYHRRF